MIVISPSDMAKGKKQGKSRKSRPRKTVRQTSGFTGPNTVIPHLSFGPRVTKETLAYADTRDLTEAAAGVGAYYIFRLNSIYDPDFTGVGNTAYGYSVMSNLWSKYRVLRTRVVIDFSNVTGGLQITGLSAGLNSTLAALPRAWPVQPRTVSRVIRGAGGGTTCVAHFDMTYDLAKVIGVTKQQYKNENDYAGIFGSNPNYSLFLIVWNAGKTAVAETSTMTARIFYETEFYGPIQSVMP